MRRLIALSCVLFWSGIALAVDPEVLADSAQDARYRELLSEIRCVVCQNQTLADSNAPLAVDLREQIRGRIETGASDDEIVAYLTDRYGDFVLYRPPFNAVTALLWLSPLVLLFVAGFIAWRAMSRPERVMPDLDAAERERVRALLRKGEST